MTGKRKTEKAPAKAGAVPVDSAEITRLAERVHHWIDHAPDDADLLVNLYWECVEVGERYNAPNVTDAARQLLFLGGITPQDARTTDATKLYKRRLVQAIHAMNAPTLKTGSKVRKPFLDANDARSKRSKATRNKWQKLADAKWAEPQHKDKSAAAIAGLIAKPGENPDTIRRKIKKLA